MPLYIEKAQLFDAEQRQVEEEKKIAKKERVNVDQIKSHMQQFNEIRAQNIEQATKDRLD